MPGGGGTQTTTDTNTVDPAIVAGQTQTADTARTLLSPFMQTPSTAVAGFNPDQMAAADGYRNLFNEIQNYRGPTGQASVTNASGAQLDPNSIQQFMNPYTQNVVDTTMTNMRDQYDKSTADRHAQLAAGSAYGGSRQAVGDAIAQKDFGNQTAQTVAQLMSQGYSQAQATALANTQMAQQTSLANASAANSTANNNASREASNYNDWFSHAQQALQGLNGVGTQQQQTTQQAINVPMDMLTKLIAATPGWNAVGGTSTKVAPDNTPDPMMQLLGLGLTLASKSDENTKTNVDELGKDPKTGLMMVAYDDKQDVARAKKQGTPMPPKRVSVMAQDIEKKMPGSTKMAGKTRVVPQNLMDMIMQGAS